MDDEYSFLERAYLSSLSISSISHEERACYEDLLRRKLKGVPDDAIQSFTITDIIEQTPRALHLTNIPADLQLGYFLAHRHLIDADNSLALKDRARQDVNTTRLIFYYRLDDSHQFQRFHDTIRWNVAIIMAMLADFWIPPAAMAAPPAAFPPRARAFCIAYLGAVLEHHETPGRFDQREMFIRLWKDGPYDFVRLNSAGRRAMRKRLKRLNDPWGDEFRRRRDEMGEELFQRKAAKFIGILAPGPKELRYRRFPEPEDEGKKVGVEEGNPLLEALLVMGDGDDARRENMANEKRARMRTKREKSADGDDHQAVEEGSMTVIDEGGALSLCSRCKPRDMLDTLIALFSEDRDEFWETHEGPHHPLKPQPVIEVPMDPKRLVGPDCEPTLRDQTPQAEPRREDSYSDSHVPRQLDSQMKHNRSRTPVKPQKASTPLPKFPNVNRELYHHHHHHHYHGEPHPGLGEGYAPPLQEHKMHGQYHGFPPTQPVDTRAYPHPQRPQVTTRAHPHPQRRPLGNNPQERVNHSQTKPQRIQDHDMHHHRPDQIHRFPVNSPHSLLLKRSFDAFDDEQCSEPTEDKTPYQLPTHPHQEYPPNRPRSHLRNEAPCPRRSYGSSSSESHPSTGSSIAPHNVNRPQPTRTYVPYIPHPSSMSYRKPQSVRTWEESRQGATCHWAGSGLGVEKPPVYKRARITWERKAQVGY